MCWGNNEDGQLGDGLGACPGARSTAPIAVKGLNDAEELAGGDAHVCARRRAGSVVCWGLGGHGQLGAITERSATPLVIPGLSKVVQVVSGANHARARRSGGDVLCWGRDTEGQLGDETRGSKPKPVPVVGLADATLLVAGGNHTCALRRSGAVACWGATSTGSSATASPACSLSTRRSRWSA